MKDSYYIYEFFIRLLKCFCIIMFFGLLLPELLDYILFNYINKKIVYENSILVNNMINKNKLFILNYYLIVKQFIKI
ncbi:hypothetical protein GCM10008905_16410 [Clostridium malenominatum]|uniref:Endonuclease III n=1 Tax=Clostridium malenominatum TaxID=1539 RepID=A0ABN1IXT9_9CLOT